LQQQLPALQVSARQELERALPEEQAPIRQEREGQRQRAGLAEVPLRQASCELLSQLLLSLPSPL